VRHGKLQIDAQVRHRAAEASLRAAERDVGTARQSAEVGPEAVALDNWVIWPLAGVEAPRAWPLRRVCRRPS
jgi:Tfp pilus assembly protein PilX